MNQLDKVKNQTAEPKDLVAKNEFQEYKSARPAVRLMTSCGVRITFAHFTLLTQTKEVIEYLDKEIAKGLPGITKGKLLTSEEVDPMATLRRKMKEEARAELIAEAKAKAEGKVPDFGTNAAKTLNVATSASVAK